MRLLASTKGEGTSECGRKNEDGLQNRHWNLLGIEGDGIDRRPDRSHHNILILHAGENRGKGKSRASRGHPPTTSRDTLRRGKSRTPTDHELPRGFPGGGFAMSTFGIKERQDGRQSDIATPR